MPDRLLILLSLYLFTITVAGAQTPASPFITRIFTAQDGLPHTYIYAVRQDSRGYLWIGTRYGLARFDGTRITTIPLNQSGVSELVVSHIHEDEQGKIWLYTTSGLYYSEGNRFRPYMGRKNFPVTLGFRENQHEPRELWTLEKNQLIRVDHSIGVKSLTVQPFRDTFYHRIAFADNGMYFNTKEDILFRKKNGVTESLREQLPPYRFIVLMGYWNSRLYLYTDNGVYHFHGGKIRTLYTGELKGQHVYSAYRDRKNRIWVATEQKGVLVSQINDEDHLTWSLSVPHTLVSGFTEDNDGNLWISSFEGLIRVREKKFLSFTKEEFFSLKDLCNIVMLPNGKLSTFSETAGMTGWSPGKFSQTAAGARNRYLVDIYCRDDKDRLWCLTRGNRLFILDEEKVHFVEDPVLKSSSDLEWHITYDSLRKKIWIPGDQLYVGDELGFRIFKDTGGNSILEPKGLLGLGEGRLLVFTKRGELILVGNDNSTRRIRAPDSIKPENIYRLFRDSTGYIIISYPGDGLLQCSLGGRDSLRLLRKFSTENGLANNFVQSFIQDRKGRYWISTMAGLSIIDKTQGYTRSMRVYNLGMDDGLPGVGYEYGRLLRGTGDQIWYSTQYSLMKFSDSIPVAARSGPTASIEEVMLHYQPTDWSRYTDSLSGLFQIPFYPVMRHTENTITISFNAATLKDKKNVRYRYLLSSGNWKKEFWSLPSPGSTISFSRLKPGDYRFFVMAGTNNQDWGQPALFSFTIREPFWQKSWFIVASLFLGFILLYLFYLLRLRQIKKEARIRNQIARDLHDDLGSTLNSVKVYANLAVLEPLNREPLEKIKEGTQEAISSVRDLVWVLDEKKDMLEHLFIRINQFAGPLCEANHIRYNQSLEDGLYAYQLNREEKRNLYLILKEAINNCIKYAGCRNITVSADQDKKKLRLSVSDDGSGFDLETVLKGNGLENIINRAGEIHYHAEFCTAPGKGTTLLLMKK